MRDFIGRAGYLGRLEALWSGGGTRLVSIYGRRRVGKTAIIERFAAGKRAFIFEAVEGEDTPGQVKHFLEQLSGFAAKPHIRDLAYRDWPPAFDLLTEILKGEESVLVAFDELPWMAAGRTRLVSYLKYYWDNRWKGHPHLILILCGSVASWMLKNVIRANALYGRMSEGILVDPLKPHEVAEFIGKRRGQREALEYYLCFGGIPRYLEEFDFNRSIQINIEGSCLAPSGFFVEEADKIFYNQFKETSIYKRIVRRLSSGPLPLEGIARGVRIPSGGGLKMYLDNLVAAGIVDRKEDLKRFKVSRTASYYVVDELLHFHANFIRPNIEEIRHSGRPNKFEKLVRGRWPAFMGVAFERFCIRQRYAIAELLDFGDKVVGGGSVSGFGRDGFQFDLAFIRKDPVITLCEVKYLSEQPSTKLIKEFEEKLSRVKLPRGVTVEKALISNQPPSRALAESGYFHRILLADEIVHYE